MTTSAVDDRPRAADLRPPDVWRSAVAGAVAAAVALGISELLAGLLPSTPSLVLAVGDRVVDLVPPALRERAIALFGTADKPALLVGIVVLSLAFGALLGRVAARRFAAGAAGFGAFAVLGLLATLGDPQYSAVLGAVSAAVSGAAGIVALARLLQAAAVASVSGDARRRFVRHAGVTLGAAFFAAVAGRRLMRGRASESARSAVVLPGADRPLAPPPPSLPVARISPLVTPNRDFYRIDTALSVPQVDLATWRLDIDGMVDAPGSLTYDDLLGMELVEADVTLCCVSNEVGGSLIGNARWLGVPLATLLERAGVQPGADQVVGHSVDGWTGGFPTAIATDGRAALVAVGMNGEPLPVPHGFPARLVVPGLYGYVSATKWLARIQLTTWEGFDGYWVPRGWSKEGPIKTSSRIDVPTPGRIPAGRTAVAGVAWAQHRGIAGVEVQVDDGPWQPAGLSDELHVDTWRQWVLDWDAPPGRHTLRVRATDATGEVQTADRAPVAPNGATGHHTITVTVT
jgi:DMSO/TMAO reductase YedYZ molybdopterin-dependent catalytic subunit